MHGELEKREDEWLWGWDTTPGIVSVWAEGNGRATVWRRDSNGTLLREDDKFRPWILLDNLQDLQHLGNRLVNVGENEAGESEATDDDALAVHLMANNRVREQSLWTRRLSGTGALCHLVSAHDLRTLTTALLDGASRRLGRRVAHTRDLDERSLLLLPPDEQYLVATGRTYFRDLSYDDVRRMQFDLETTGLTAEDNRIFMIAVRHPDGRLETLEASGDGDAAEAALVRELIRVVQQADPDVIENHNLHGFDLPFLETRSRILRVPLTLGRLGHRALIARAAQRGAPSEYDSGRRVRYVAPGREFIDTLDAVRRYDFSARDLPGHGLKAVARHLGIAGPEREYIRGDQIYTTWRTDPDRVRRYATDDVVEVAALSRMLGGAAFALARMAPRRYERLADAGAATGVIDPLLVRAYMRAGVALPAHADGDGTVHTGAALHLFATGVARRVVKADVASLYPSLMREYRIGPARDTLGAMLFMVDRLVEQRLAAKANARRHPRGSAERNTFEAMSAAMKVVVNSAYGYLGAGGNLTRFADVYAANEVTRRGRETLSLMCRELDSRGVTLLEADTDGVYFAVPSAWSEEDERRIVSEVAALLPRLVQLEFEGRYAAMLSHEPKNYALLSYGGELLVRGVAFRSSRAEPYGDAFLRRALRSLLSGDVPGVRGAYEETLGALRRRELPTYAVSSRVRLTKSHAEYAETREKRRELTYEALLNSGRTEWTIGDRVRVYRTENGLGGVVDEHESGAPTVDDHAPNASADARRDYDVEYYGRLLRDSFASRMVRAFTPEDFETVFADPMQPSLFLERLGEVSPVLDVISAEVSALRGSGRTDTGMPVR